MSVQTQSLGLVGLSPAESTMVRLLIQVLEDRFDRPWEVVDNTDADVVLADPASQQGSALLGRRTERPRIIAVLNRGQTTPASASAPLHRPFRAEELVQALNTTESGTLPDTLLQDEEVAYKPLAQGLRDALTDPRPGCVHLISDIGESPLIIQPQSDRLRGPFRSLRAEMLASGSIHTVRSASSMELGPAADHSGETRLRPYLWQLTDAPALDRRPLFAQADTAKVRMVNWPRLTGVRFTGQQLRVIGLIRERGLQIEQIARTTDIDRSELIALLNATWLTGDLETARVETITRSNQHSAVPGDAGHKRSLLGRIRERIGSRAA